MLKHGNVIIGLKQPINLFTTLNRRDHVIIDHVKMTLLICRSKPV